MKSFQQLRSRPRQLLITLAGSVLLLAQVATGPAQAAVGAGLSLDKSQFAPGEPIVVHFLASSSFAANAWVGIIPSSVPHGSEATNDQHDLTYQYLEGRTSGDLTFQAPADPGAYDLRMHDTDDNGKEVASVSFTVGGGSGSLRLDQTAFAPGEQVVVHFRAAPTFARNAWVGIIPSSVAHGSEATNDQHDLTYQYLEGRASGDLIFQAPANPGAYDCRMHDTDDNGKEVASVSFTVGGAPAMAPASGGGSLRLDKSVFQPGENIVVHFTAAATFDRSAWVGIIPSHIAHGSEATNDQHDLTYQYLEKRTAGDLVFQAPGTPGSYDFRLHDTDNNGKEISSVSFTVVAP